MKNILRSLRGYAKSTILRFHKRAFLFLLARLPKEWVALKTQNIVNLVEISSEEVFPIKYSSEEFLEDVKQITNENLIYSLSPYIQNHESTVRHVAGVDVLKITSRIIVRKPHDTDTDDYERRNI